MVGDLLMLFNCTWVFTVWGFSGRGYGMPLTFVPNAGDVLMCNFDGFQPPEMIKTRRVIILSPKSRTHFPDTFLVVPVSKTKPIPPQNHHCEFKPRAYQFFDQAESVWALANMLTCVKKGRLDRMWINGRFTEAKIRKEDLMAVRQAVLHAMGMESWKQVVETIQPTQASIRLRLEAVPVEISTTPKKVILTSTGPSRTIDS